MPVGNDFLQDMNEPFLHDLRALVSIDCGTGNKAGVDQAGAWVARRAEEWGWPVERIPQGEYGDCWISRLPGSGRGQVLLAGHLDTVYPDGTAAARPMHTEGEKLLGPGVCDMKGGLLVGMYAMRALQLAGQVDFEAITFFFNSEEEVGSPVSRPEYAPIAQAADAALVLEAGRANGNIVSARKGSGTFRLHVTGHAAHAGVEPEKGINAVVELARRIGQMQRLNAIAPGVTVNVTRAGGGTAANAIPDTAWFDLDVRVANQAGLETVQQAILREARRRSVVPGARVHIEGDFHNPPMERTPTVAYLALLAKETAQGLGFQLDEAATGGASDANNIAALGVPVLDGLGPVGGLDHSPDEYILPESILPRTRLLTALIRRILEDRDQLAALRK